jgi:signal transduction histidine kinase
MGSPARLITIDTLLTSGEVDGGTVEKLRAHEFTLQPLAKDAGVIMYRAVLESQYVAALQVASPPQPKVFGVFTTLAMTWIVESLLYAIAILLWLRLFWRDLRKLTGAAERIGEGVFGENLQLRSGSALKPLADSINRMTARIGALMRSHKDLTNAVSHELKTPLSRLRFALTLFQDVATSTERDRLLKKMHYDIDELDALVQEMLLYSKLDRDTPTIAIAPSPVESWLPAAVEDEIEAAEARDLHIPVAVAMNVLDVPCEPRYMARAVRNLVRNALRFANARVEVTVAREHDLFVIHVDDDGPGIAEADHARLFVPFARIDDSRSRDSGGSGLGLAIVQRIAEWHGGRASITTSPLGGTRISIIWSGVTPPDAVSVAHGPAQMVAPLPDGPVAVTALKSTA